MEISFQKLLKWGFYLEYYLINEDIRNIIKVGQMKRGSPGMLCEKRIHWKIKEKLYKTLVRHCNVVWLKVLIENTENLIDIVVTCTTKIE